MELQTAVRNRLSLVHVVMNDSSYDMVAFQEVMKYGRTSGTELGSYDVVKFAEAFGAAGLRVKSEADLPSVLATAFATPGVVVVDTPVNYDHNVDLALLPGSGA